MDTLPKAAVQAPSGPRKTGAGAFGMSHQELRGLLKRRLAPVLARIVVLVGLWVGLGAWVLQVDVWWGKVAIWAMMGFVINGMVQLSHETWHNNLFEARWANTAFGVGLGLLVGISHAALKHDHLMHHRHNRTAMDPDAYNAGRDSLGQRVLFYAVVLFGLPLSVIYFNVLYPLQWFERRKLPGHFARVLLGAVGYAALFGGLWRVGVLGQALEVWIIPLIATGPFNGLKSIADHHNNVWRGGRFQTATTVRSNAVVTWFWSGLNYHLDHHLFPRVPGYNLPRLHRHLRPTLLKEGAPVYDSYLSTMWAALKAGPLVVDEDVQLVSVKRRREDG